MVRAAVEAEDVSGILLVVESPGGTYAGTQVLADEVWAASHKKPVYIFIDDLATSAAYWIASQAERIYTLSTGIVGSLGTYMVIADSSKLTKSAGIQIHVVKAGELKGAGTPGTTVTTPQLDAWQKLVDASNDLFLSAVARGRRMSLSKVRALADGRVHLGDAALRLGLIDGIKSFDETLEELKRRCGKSSSDE